MIRTLYVFLDWIDIYLKFVSPEIGQIICNIIDRNIWTCSKHKDDLERSECEECFVSGALNNTKTMKKWGADPVFIDGVELDISCKLGGKGYKLLHLHFQGLLHELGEGKNIIYLDI